MDYHLKRLPSTFRLTWDKDSAIVQRLGAGRFCTAYRQVDTDTVYLVVNSEAGDHSKEILSHCNGPYMPQLTRVGDLGSKDVWRTVYYRRLRASDKMAWAEYRAIAKCRELAWSEVVINRNRDIPLTTLGYTVMSRTVELLQEREPQRTALIEQLEALASAACDYGASYTFEFAVRNLAVDTAGFLILLDPVFDLETIERDHLKRVQASRSIFSR